MQSHSRAVLVGQAFAGCQEFVSAHARGKGHGPGADAAVQLSIEFLDGGFNGLDSVSGGRNRQSQRTGFVGYVGASDDSAAGLLVSVQAPVNVFRAAGIHECGGAVLQKFSDCQEAGVVFLLFSHDGLKFENVGQVGRAQVVGEDSSGGVSVADMHVPVDESRCDYHVRGIDHAISLDLG